MSRRRPVAESMTFADAAYKLLKKSVEPRDSQWITEEALYWRFIRIRGKTPADTMYAVLYTEIRNKGPGRRRSPFMKRVKACSV